MNHMGTGGLQSFKVDIRPSSLIMSQNPFLHDKKGQCLQHSMCKLMFIYWKDFAEARLSFTEPHKKNDNNSQCKQTQSRMDLLAIIESHR